MAETLYSSPKISPKNKFEHFHKVGTEVSQSTFGYIDPWKMKSLPFSPPSAWKADTGGWWQTLTRNCTHGNGSHKKKDIFTASKIDKDP